jgi:hypothetical protein
VPNISDIGQDLKIDPKLTFLYAKPSSSNIIGIYQPFAMKRWGIHRSVPEHPSAKYRRDWPRFDQVDLWLICLLPENRGIECRRKRAPFVLKLGGLKEMMQVNLGTKYQRH